MLYVSAHIRGTTLTSYIDLKDVTLVTVTGVHVDSSQRALQRSMEGIRFHSALLIASEAPSVPDPRIRFIKIPPMTLSGYSGFMLNHLHRFISTPHVLVVQADGYVINPGQWDMRWLDYDYIGAPWPPTLGAGPFKFTLNNRVGNGGFSLRSRRLLQFTPTINWRRIKFQNDAEDVLICHLAYGVLIHNGFRFPDIEMAAAFSIERKSVSFGRTLDTVFGFHGNYYLPRVLEREASAVRA